MLHEVRIRNKSHADTRGKTLLREIKQTLGISSLEKIETVKVYRFEGLDDIQVAQLAQSALCESIHQTCIVNKPAIEGASYAVEVANKPGVMNPEVGSLFKVAQALSHNALTAIDTSWEYHFYGEITKDQVSLIIDRLLVNKTTQKCIVTKPSTLVYSCSTKKVDTVCITYLTDKELERLSKANNYYLNLDEMKVIQNFFSAYGREPFDAELETIAQTWSEHCCHKTFSANLVVDGKEKEPLFTRLKKTALQYSKDVVSAFEDNSGAYAFYDDFAMCGKVETHNSPSAIEPYGGAATGSGGVFRDIMGTGQGAKVIASTDMFCVAPPDIEHNNVPPGCLHPRYILRNIVAGVRDYGNRMGVPTNNGSVHFHNDFRAKPSVIVGAYGLMPTKYAQKGVPHVGDKIFVVGGKTGRDGIHGATFSSGNMTADTQTRNASAVQIGNPIEEKRMTDALLACRDKNLIRALTDCGAGGFSSAIGEMGAQLGVRVYLERAPLKYQGLAPWEIWISEAQERMVCAIAPEHVQAFIATCADYNVPVTQLGEFTGNKQLHVTYHEQEVCNLPMDFLHNGLPQRVMYATKPERMSEPLCLEEPQEYNQVLLHVMAHPNICSKEPIVRQYDHGVQGTNVLPPFTGTQQNGPNDATVLRPFQEKSYGMIISHGMNPVLNSIDPYRGSIWAIVEALSNYVAVGGDYTQAVLIDNFIWPFPDQESLWDLDQALDACVDAMHAFGRPFISGKDSLSSTYTFPNGQILKIPPVLCVSVFGKIPDITKTVSSDLKKESVLVLFGDQDLSAMGASVYAEVCSKDTRSGDVPNVDLALVKKTFDQLHQLISQDIILSCHDVSEGGIATALAEMCIGGQMGAEVMIPSDYGRSDYVLFNETPGCFVAEIPSEYVDQVLQCDIPCYVLGKTTPKNNFLKISDNDRVLVNVSVHELLQAWKRPMREVFG